MLFLVIHLITDCAIVSLSRAIVMLVLGIRLHRHRRLTGLAWRGEAAALVDADSTVLVHILGRNTHCTAARAANGSSKRASQNETCGSARAAAVQKCAAVCSVFRSWRIRQYTTHGV